MLISPWLEIHLNHGFKRQGVVILEDSFSTFCISSVEINYEGIFYLLLVCLNLTNTNEIRKDL